LPHNLAAIALAAPPIKAAFFGPVCGIHK